MLTAELGDPVGARTVRLVGDGLLRAALTGPPATSAEVAGQGLRTLARHVMAQLELREYARGLDAVTERLRDADRIKDEFIARVTHELRTPLTSINGYLEVLDDPDLEPDDGLDRPQPRLGRQPGPDDPRGRARTGAGRGRRAPPRAGTRTAGAQRRQAHPGRRAHDERVGRR